MRTFIFPIVLCACATAVSAQVGEISVSGGASRFGDKSLGTVANDITSGNITMKDGFRLAIRLTLNTWRFMGHEFGYGYAHSGVKIPGSGDVSVPVHQGFYNFLVYPTPEGASIRPFITGGGQFSSFFPPGTSAYYGNQITKFGFNYGGGVKFKITSIFGMRFDLRQYATPQPFDFPNSHGWLKQTEITAGLSFNF